MTEFNAYRLPNFPPMALVPASRFVDWRAPPAMFVAHRCAPIAVATMAGWHILNPSPVTVRWDGRPEREGVTVECDYDNNSARSMLGAGTVSWWLPFLLRTPPGWSTLIRGPANLAIDGAAPIEGTVETDAYAGFAAITWRLTRPGQVVFDADFPVAQVVPFRRGDIESLSPIIRDIEADDAEHERYLDYMAARRPGVPSGKYARDAAAKPTPLRPFVEA